MERMVKVTNMIDSRVGINLPEMGFKRRWEKRNQSIPIPFDTLQMLLYDDGVANMFRQGMLYIDDLKTKQDLGLEPLEATAPVNIIALNETQMRELLTNKPIAVFKKEVSQLADSQIDNLIDFAISQKIVNVDKCSILKEITGRDVINAIKLQEDIAQEEAQEKRRAAEGRRI